MKQKSYIILGVFVVLSLIVFVFTHIRERTPETQEAKAEIKIGFMLPLTGQFAGIGEGIKNAGLLAVEDYENQHPESHVNVIIEDDALDVKKGITAYTKLTTLDHIEGMIMVSTPVLDAIHEKMTADGLPIVSIGLQNDGVGDDNIFQTTLEPQAPIRFLAQAIEEKGYGKIAVVYNSKITATTLFHDTFVGNYHRPYVTYVVNEAVDAKVVATKIMNDGIKAVVILNDATGGPMITKELKTLDAGNTLSYYYDIQLGTGWSEYEKILGDTNVLNGAYTLMIKGGDMTEFSKAYKTQFDIEPAPYAEYGYDSVMALLTTHEKDQQDWVTNLKTFTMTGPSGGMRFDQNGVRLQEIALTTVVDGKIK